MKATPHLQSVEPSSPPSLHPTLSEAYEAEDRCFRVSVAGRFMLPHPAASDPQVFVWHAPTRAQRSRSVPNRWMLNSTTAMGAGTAEVSTAGHAAVARCPADVIHSHNSTKVYIEQASPALTRMVNGQVEHVRMDLVFDHNGSTTYLGVASSHCCSQYPTRSHGQKSIEEQI